MDIIKRNGQAEGYDRNKITTAVRKAFVGTNAPVEAGALEAITAGVEDKMRVLPPPVQVEQIQDLVEETLMTMGYFAQSKSYILYRSERTRKRGQRKAIAVMFAASRPLATVLAKVQKDYPAESYELSRLEEKFRSFVKPGMGEDDKMKALVRAAAELTTQEAPRWEFIAARLLMLQFEQDLAKELEPHGLHTLYDKISFWTREGLYGDGPLSNSDAADEEADRITGCLRSI